MEKIRGVAFRLSALFIFLISNVGCLSPVAINTIGAAGSGAPASVNHLGGGKGEGFYIARYEDVTAAAMRAAEALSLEVREKKIEKDRTFFRFADDRGKTIDLTIDRRTDTMTSILFDVGWFGSIAFGRLLANQIVQELNESDAFLEDWKPETDE
ncbi:MAG: DUF3568 family protein [Desulfobacterales bacterium]|nr:MAG: DUF3568 family protein [Desulfobacterales bacterium]